MSDRTSETGSARQTDSGLTERQRTILEVIRASVVSRGYPPSIREIGDAVAEVAHRRIGDEQHLVADDRVGRDVELGVRRAS